MKNYSSLLLIYSTSILLLSCSKNQINANESFYERPIVPIMPIIESEVQIGTQIWKTKNLSVSRYRDGTIIPQITDSNQWANMTTGAWCYYDNSTANGSTYGKLYNWYAVAGIYDAASAANPALRKKIAPSGWHVPTNDEWSVLTEFLHGEFQGAGGRMKATGTTLWRIPNVGATNESGFTGLPGGFRNLEGTFDYIHERGTFWSSSETESIYAFNRNLFWDDVTALSYYYEKTYGFSVRCLRD